MTVLLMDRADLRSRVDKALMTFLSHRREWLVALESDALTPVADALDSFVLGGGKRLRPAFGYWGYRAAGGTDRDEVVATLAALELLQASALIHDDLIDGSDTRRGEPSVHRRFGRLHREAGWSGSPDGFGEAAAILLGDLCLAWSDEMLHASGLDPYTLARARPVFDAMRSEVMVGQYLDMQTQASGNTSAQRASLVASYKSARYTIEKPLLLGAAIADASAELCRAYSGFGLPLGEAFQLRDDVLGVFGDPAVTGKPAGDDLREGKRTYLIAVAEEAATDAQLAVLRARLGDRALDAAGVAQLRQIITDTGALDRTERRITELTRTALAVLAAAPVDPAPAEVLVQLAGWSAGTPAYAARRADPTTPTARA